MWYNNMVICGYDGIGRHARFRFSCFACGFESHYPYQKESHPSGGFPFGTQLYRTRNELRSRTPVRVSRPGATVRWTVASARGESQWNGRLDGGHSTLCPQKSTTPSWNPRSFMVKYHKAKGGAARWTRGLCMRSCRWWRRSRRGGSDPTARSPGSLVGKKTPGWWEKSSATPRCTATTPATGW